MKTITPLLTFSLFAPVFSPVAHAEDGHFTIPNWVQPNTASPTGNAGSFFSQQNIPPSCQDKTVLLTWLRAWKERARLGYAQMVMKNIPSLTPGATCIKAPEAFDAKHEPVGDYFSVSCLAQTRGRLSHLFKMEILVEPGSCLSDAELIKFTNSPQCKVPGEPHRYLNLQLSPCPIGSVPPKLRPGANTNAAYPIDPAFFARLLNDRPTIRNIVDEDRRVKVGPTNPGGGDCTNPLGCWPGANTSTRDAK